MSIFNRLLGDNPPNRRRRDNSNFDGGDNFDDDTYSHCDYDDDNDSGDGGDGGGGEGGGD